MSRKSLKIREPTARRFARWQRADESQTDALARLLDEAGVPEKLHCVECGDPVQDHVRDSEGTVYCYGCADVERPEL